MIATVTLVVAAYTGVDHVVQRLTVEPSFEELERTEAEKDLARVIGTIRGEIEHLDQRCRDWASSDETYRFVAEPYEEYVRSRLGSNSFADGNVNVLYICDPDGVVVWGDAVDLETGGRLELRELPREKLNATHQYLVLENAMRGELIDESSEPAWRGYISGLVVTEHGAMLLSCRPILPSSASGPIRGTIIMGRLLSDTNVAALEARTAVSFDRWRLTEELPESTRAVLDQVTGSADPVVVEGDDTLHVHGVFPDIDGYPALVLRANVAREITNRGATVLRYALLSTMSAGFLLLLVLLTVLQRTVLRPLEKLTQHAVKIGRGEEPPALEANEREDEIGILSRALDLMLGQLARSRAEVVATARKAGRSEIATGILHNVGNVLNSVNVSASIVAERVRNSKVEKLDQLAGLVQEQGEGLSDFIAHDRRGRALAPYLGNLAQLMRVEQDTVQTELAELEVGIEHIRRLVSSQQSYAGHNDLNEPTDLAAQLDRALELGEQAGQDDGRLTVVREFDSLPRVRTDQHKLVDILVNLIANARQATERVIDPTLTLRLAERDEHVILQVSDNGVGIPTEHLTRVFEHGFTTREKGNGFGLHAAANAAVELGGCLSVESPGPGRGATFTLELPLDAVGAKARAAARAS
jgi:sensor domain CHASE-containing protein/nitrogen-specific signal transduction histidine kinase